MKFKRLTIILLAMSGVLLIPFIAMQFTNEVDWDSTDFITMGALLFGTGFLCELVLRIVKSTKHRIILCGGILFMLFFVWAELAVGIFGTPFAGS